MTAITLSRPPNGARPAGSDQSPRREPPRPARGHHPRAPGPHPRIQNRDRPPRLPLANRGRGLSRQERDGRQPVRSARAPERHDALRDFHDPARGAAAVPPSVPKGREGRSPSAGKAIVSLGDRKDQGLRLERSSAPAVAIEPLLTAAEVGRLLAIPTKRVYEVVGHLAIQLAPHTLRWRLSDIMALIEARRRSK